MALSEIGVVFWLPDLPISGDGECVEGVEAVFA